MQWLDGLPDEIDDEEREIIELLRALEQTAP
jgi:hypothetical protein